MLYGRASGENKLLGLVHANWGDGKLEAPDKTIMPMQTLYLSITLHYNHYMSFEHPNAPCVNLAGGSPTVAVTASKPMPVRIPPRQVQSLHSAELTGG